MKQHFIKPNPYVFPFTEFENLAKGTAKQPNKEKVVELGDIRQIINKYNERFPLKFSAKPKSSVSEQLFQFFISPEVRFGNLSMYLTNKSYWIKKFNQALMDKGMSFSLLGFPFKTPVALKTSRVLPDLGEIIALNRLENIAKVVEKISQKPTIVNIITEGIFAKFVGIDPKIARRYELQVKKLAEDLNFTHLKFIPLARLETYDKNFEKLFTQKVKETQNLYQLNDRQIVGKIRGAYDSILRIVNPKIKDLSLLREIYNFDIPDEKLSVKAKKIRDYLRNFALRSTIQYFSLLELRDELGFLENELGKKFIPLTISPKPSRLGIIPISSGVKLLPHHGVPTLRKNGQSFNIEYLIDLLRSKKHVTQVFLKKDKDNAPFYYQIS